MGVGQVMTRPAGPENSLAAWDEASSHQPRLGFRQAVESGVFRLWVMVTIFRIKTEACEVTWLSQAALL